jgi:hypothetical protein
VPAKSAKSQPKPAEQSKLSPNEVPLDFARDWVEFADPDKPEKEAWRCDLTWLTSSWTCIYGSGCKGIIAERPNDGCCTHGAHFSDAADEKRVRKWADLLTPETWEFFDEGRPKKKKTKLDIVERDEDGDRKTRLVEGACIFLNRAGFAGGEGCALHHLANNQGVHFVETKPDVCWQLPIRRSFENVARPDGVTVEVTVLGEFDRRGWGPGGVDFDWYCTGNSEAHIGTEPVYLSNRVELIATMGEKAYAILADLATARLAAQAAAKARHLPLFAVHPASVRANNL